MDWSVLGIEATKDKKTITKAYRGKLIHTNPEDKPEEFKALRAAYEEAMALADQTEEPEAEKTPLDLWLDKLAALYSNFQSRMNVDCWRELLSEDICQALDTRPDAEEAMLRFLMVQYHLTHSVWVYLDEEFSFLERKDELYEKYPREFVDYVVINGILYEDHLPYALFEPGENAAECEYMIKLFNQADSAPITEIAEQLAELEKLSERHPYTEALAIQYRISQGQTEAIGDLKDLSGKHPSDLYLNMALIGEYCTLERWQEAEEAAGQCLKLELPSDFAGAARWYMAQALAGQEKYEEAINHLNEMMHLCTENDSHLEALNKVRIAWNEKLIERYRKELDEKPDNPKMWLDLAWCYLENDKNTEAAECASHVPENQPDIFDYNNLMCLIYLAQKEFESALHCNGALLEVLEEMRRGTMEKDDKKLKRLPEMLSKRGVILSSLCRYAEADEAFTRALSVKPDDKEALNYIIRAKISSNQYEDALNYAERYAEIIPQEFMPHYYLALIQKMLRNDRAAFAESNTAIELDPSDFRGYELKLLILIRNEVYDQAHELIDFLKENGVGEILSVRWCEEWLAKEETEDTGAALETYQKLAEEIERDGNDYYWLPEFYSQLADLTATDHDNKNICDRKTILDILDKGLASYPEDFHCLEYKAWLLKREKRRSESREIYEKLIQRPHRGVRFERELADIYYADLEKNADKAVEMYRLIIEKDEKRDDHFYAGMSYFTMGNLEEARKHFLREVEIDPDDEDGYYRVSFIYEAMGLYEEALRQADRSIELVKSWNDGKCHSARFEHKAQIFRRMGKPEEAVKVYRDAMALYGKQFNGHQLIVNTYLQFGMWDKAEEVMKEWKKSTRNVLGNKYNMPRLEALVRSEFLLKKFVKAKLSFTSYAGAMYESDRDALSFLVESSDRSAEKYLEIRKKSLDSLDPDHGDYPGFLSGYADALWLNGRQDEAKKYAQIALDKLDEVLKRFHRNRTMHLAKKISLLYLLGRTEEAKACYEDVVRQPMCELCSYHGCKDADIYTVRGLIYQGKKEEALKLIEEMEKKWPDETDFIFYENLLRKGNL